MEWYYVWWPWLTSKRVAQVCQHQLTFLFLFLFFSCSSIFRFRFCRYCCYRRPLCNERKWPLYVFGLSVRRCVHTSEQHHSFNGHFPGQPGLDGTRLSLIWILLALTMMEVVATTAAVLKPTPGFLQAGCPSGHSTNSVKALKGNPYFRNLVSTMTGKQTDTLLHANTYKGERRYRCDLRFFAPIA